jgi:pimeloyl-ACP methyl ester carboxylesterase
MGMPVNGIEIEWRERGSGDVILFVHGFPFNSAMWGYQLSALPPRWRGIAPDLRGFGASGQGGADVYGMDLFAHDLAVLLERLAIERVVLCGLSMGGYIAFEFWKQWPERVRALVLCDTRAGPDSPDAQRARRNLAERVMAEGARVVVDAMLPKLLAPATLKKKPGVVAMVRAMMEETPAPTLARALLGMAVRPDSEPVLSTIDVPVLVVVGNDDAITSRGQGEMLARGIRGARLEVIPAAGHLPNLEQPEEFNQILIQFLAGLPRDTVSTRGVLRA